MDFASATNLTDLNDHCLEEIFLKLSVNDLARVTEVCKRFHIRAVAAFSRNFKNKKVWLSNDKRKHRSDAYRVLRAFGSRLQKVGLLFNDKHNDPFFNAIVQQSGSNLIEIDFICTVSRWCALDKDIFLKFPKMESLTIEINAVDSECIAQNIPTLKHASLSTTFSNFEIEKFIKLNPQLESLDLNRRRSFNRIKYNETFLQFIDENLPQLEHLGLSWDSDQSNLSTFPFRTLDAFEKFQSLRLLRPRVHGKPFQYLIIYNHQCNLYNERYYEKLREYEIPDCNTRNRRLDDLTCQRMKCGMQRSHLKQMNKQLTRRSQTELSGSYDILNDDIIEYIRQSE